MCCPTCLGYGRIRRRDIPQARRDLEQLKKEATERDPELVALDDLADKQRASLPRYEVHTMSVEERWTNVDGLRIRYLEAGSGPAIIMVHGVQAFLSADIFTGVMEPIAADGLS